jgi:hypothetical protein
LNSDRELSFKEFTRDFYQRSRLQSDLQDTLAKLARIGVPTKKYETAPHMFTLIGDEAAFVEQYSYGKLAKKMVMSDEELILGSDMPLIEYQKKIDPVYARVLKEILSEGKASGYEEQLRPQPYPLLVDHFEYAWEQAKEPRAFAAGA